MKYVICILFFFMAVADGAIRLYNDSAYKLRAVIRAADGTYVGEMLLLPGHFSTWSQDYMGYSGEQPSRSQTPYTVHWVCLDGAEYGVCQNVTVGGMVLAGGCDGPKYCRPPPKAKQQGPYGAKEGDEQLHEKNEADEEPPESSDETDSN